MLSEKKIVALIPVKNESRHIAFCLQAVAKFADAICVSDEASDDNTVQIIESLAAECRVERIIKKQAWNFNETQRRQPLLDAGREIGGTHFIVFDADEAFTSNLATNDYLRNEILKLKPGEQLELVSIQLWRSVKQFRYDTSVWTNHYKAFIFADERKCYYHEQIFHLERVPSNINGKSYRIEGYKYGVLHFSFVNWANLLTKQAWYRCLERIMHPQKSVHEINALYGTTKDETNIELKKSLPEWFSSYECFEEAIYDAPDQWREKQVLEWFEHYGREHFAELDIWDIDWGGGVATMVEGLKLNVPKIACVPKGFHRPFWSVMIPTYNGTKYLEQTLKSVLKQDPGQNEMQIEVIDDCSTNDDPESIVRKIGQDRVIFSQQPHNVGLVANWNTCIQRARGRWVHILHQDDLVMPGFYSCLREALEKEPTVGAAFCRHSYIDKKGDCLFLSLLERETPGILADWLELIATMQRVQFPSIVVRRSTYEALGGFCPEARSAADWEMWKRIAAYYPVWYEPQILACFRLHSASESSRLITTGTNIADTRRAIEISQSYLPDTIAHELSSKAREYYALDALNRASKMLDKRDIAAAIAQIREGLKCSESSRVIESLTSLLTATESEPLLRLFTSLKKKALVFFPHNPYPPRTGAHQRCLAMLSGLKELGYDVTLFGSTLITDSLWHSDSIKNLQNDLGINVEVYQGTQADQQFMAQVSASSRDLVNWEMYTPPGLCESFRQMFAQLAPDVVVINYALWGGLASGEEFKSAVRIIDTHDLITLNIQKRQALGRYLTSVPLTPDQIDPCLVEENFFSKLQLDVVPDEYWIYDQYDYTITMSPSEVQAIREHTHRTQVEYVPMTFTTEPLNNTYTGDPVFLVGPNPFNVQGYLYFTTKVLPVVLRQLPEFSLQVIGSACQQLIPVDGVQLLGFVPDLKPLYSESRFAVCPLIGGTGQQVKIVEAMAHGVPVIALRNVAESSPIQHGINGFIAANAEEFAEYTIQLFRNQELCRQMGQAARETIALKFSKYALLEKMSFLEPEKLQNKNIRIEKILPIIIVDGVFFQLYKTGIGRVWCSLLEEWAENGFAKHIVVLDRARTAPKIPGLRYRSVQPYDYAKTDTDREMLQQVCDEEGADLFISTYYTTPISTPSVFMAYDMIPEVIGWDLNHPMWQEKHYAIQHAAAYMAISENTARDLVKFFPQLSSESVTVALCGVKRSFFSASLEEINSFKTKYGISKPYFILVGTGGYKNTILFFRAFAQLCSRGGFDIVCTGSSSLLATEFRNYTSGSVVHMLQLSDEELITAYSGAIALVYPSKYEGFGLPVLEAIACGCPVITCPNASIPEVAGKAALYVNDEDVDGLTDALCDVQKPHVRNSLIAAGFDQAKKFSWSKMAKTVTSALIDATLLPLNLKDINLIVFPDWSQPEELLCLELERVIRAIATHPDRSQMALLVDTGNITEEDTALILSSVTMNLLLQEDLDVSEGPEISLMGQLGEIQWQALLPRIHARIILENENQQAIAQVKAETIPFCELDSFSNKQAAQLKPGIWDLTGHSEIVYFNRGMALRKQGKFAEAVNNYQKALKIKPDFAEARYQLSLTRYANQIVSKGYQFTQDWFSSNIPIWEQHLKQFINISTLNVLEIGSWEGRSTCWLLDNILTHESNKITCIDTFEGSVEHQYDPSYIQSIEGRFDFNIVRAGVPEKVQKIVGKSYEVMRNLPLNSYNLVYIDGSHIASDVLEDAVLVWQLVQVGGFIIFDDYPFSFPQNPNWNTRIGIDAFMMSFSNKIRVIHKAYQVIIEKTCN